MKLADEETAMLAGEQGPVRQWAIAHQVAVGEFFDAPDLVPVGQAHVMADTESLGEVGVAWLEGLAAHPEPERRVRIPTITDPRGLDLASYKRLKQTDAMAAIETRASRAFEALGVLMTNTCINYQTILPPVRGEHLALGDTGVTIYSNGVMGARSNFEGGPSALAAGLTGRTPRYGYHLDAHRAGTSHFAVEIEPGDFADWGALGGIVGRAANSYWQVPVITGLKRVPNSDELKHFGAALASFGSVAMFHMPGVTPEAATLRDAFQGGAAPPARTIGRADLEAFYATYAAPGDKVDVVVFAAPQLSLIEMSQVAGLLDGRRIHATNSLVVRPPRRSSSPPTAWGSRAASRMPAAWSPRACASTRATRARWRRRTAGSACSPIPPSSSISSAATATSRRSPAWSAASMARSPGRCCDADRAQVPQGASDPP